jgi:hypothetical protein
VVNNRVTNLKLISQLKVAQEKNKLSVLVYLDKKPSMFLKQLDLLLDAGLIYSYNKCSKSYFRVFLKYNSVGIPLISDVKLVVYLLNKRI